MKLTSTRLAVLAISFALVCSNCKDEDTPTDPLQGDWSLVSGYVESQTEIPSRNITTDVLPCFFDGVTTSPSATFTNALTLNSDQRGSLSWDITCTPAENYAFSWQLSGDNELTINHLSGETWVWDITSLSTEFLEVEFYRERDIDLPSSGPATRQETISLRFRKEE